MFWVDEIAEEIIKKYGHVDELVVRDEKTPSGRVHIGSMRGVVIHGIIAQALNEKGKKTRFIYEFNDADPMDGLPVYLNPEKYKAHMGKPLWAVPSPHEELGGKPAKNYAEYFANEFLEVINEIGFYPEIVWGSENYKNGLYDQWIPVVLKHKDQIREIYKDVSGGEKPQEWYPLQVICEKCGKVGTTQVIDWDGKEVTYECLPNLVSWGVGCGYKGKVSPFGGRGKFPWKAEWPVKWQIYPVDIEGSGKDHNAAGGAHDIAEEICRDVLKKTVPFNIPYEFFLFGGAKMSSSKGMGASVREVANTIPPELLRFLMVRKKPNQPIDFNPEGPTIPILFDNHDEAADYYFNKKGEFEDMERAFHYSQLNPKDIKGHFYPRFTRVAFFEQIPHLNLSEEVAKLKGGKLTKEDVEEVKLRERYAKIWLDRFAPEAYRFEVLDEIPAVSSDLSEEQKKFLKDLGSVLSEKDWEGEELHSKIHKMKELSGLDPKELFGAIYMALLGKDSGPQAGWFLEALNKNFLIERFSKVSELKKVPKKEDEIFKKIPKDRLKNDYFYLSEEAGKKYPETQVVFALIEGIQVREKDPEVKKLWPEMVPSAEEATIRRKNLSILEQYIELYKRMGVDTTKRKPTSVALFDRIAKGKDLYEINNVVDICNLMTLQNGISLGAFDADKIKFPIVFDLMKGGEMFWAFGEDKAKPVLKGEFCMKDTEGKLLNRDYNYRDSEYTKITSETKNVFLTFDALDPLPIAETQKKFEEAILLFTKYCGGKVKFKICA